MTADISRHSLRAAQKFTGVVRQQGRLPLDSDDTEDSDLAALMLRRMVTETICERGSPDDGFRISAPTVANQALDFSISAGTFYLGGDRIASDGDQYGRQPDWLTFTLDAPGPSLPAAGTQRTDLVWLYAWEQTVTATEDSELFERALGGPDTTARRRTMWGVRVLENVPDNCPEAFDDLVSRQFAGGVLDSNGCEILSNARLTVGFTQLEPLEDLCRPNAQEGFLGARNETFRIQVTQPGRFVWGRDNAAPLYRVQVTEDENGDRRRIVFLTLPRDEFGWPLAGMTVELLRWGALLDNREKVAEPQGLFLRVTNGFDPASNSVLVAADVPPEWDAWFATAEGQAAINPRDENQAYFFLRVWTGGGAGNAVDHPMNVGNLVELGETGLTATFSTTGMAGDYWIVSARPNTPTLVTPWALLDGAPPTGPRRLIAPLALLPWNGPVPRDPVDCRHRFRPLCEVGTCCRVTVGDGRNSFGDVLSIQEAVNRLPAAGGEICIHPGDYREHVVIADRRDVTITGCGRTTTWRGEQGRAEPLLTIRGSSGIHVRRLAMASEISESVFAEELSDEGRRPLRSVVLEDLSILCADTSAILIAGGDGHVVRRCQVSLGAMSQSLADDPTIGRAAALFLTGDDLLVEHCRIGIAGKRELRTQPAGGGLDFGRIRLAAGGIHIGGGSRHVTIRDNTIQGGNGHGITLGSVHFVPEEGGGFVPAPGINHYTTFVRKKYRKVSGYGSGALEFFGVPLSVDDVACIRMPGTPPGRDDVPTDQPLSPESSGLIRDVKIQRNEITFMGFSGISAHIFAGLGRDGLSDAIVVEAIDISENRILRCMRNEVGQTTPLLRLFIGWGGIALSICADATIRDNLIAGNGSQSPEPITGVFIAIAEDVKVERNRIEQNGMDPDERALNPGRRGGIVIGIAVGGISTFSELEVSRRATDRPALVVNGNIVDAPSGRALKAVLLGPAIVLGNRLTGAGRSALFSNIFGSLLPAGFALSRVHTQIMAPREEIDLSDYVLLELLADVLGGDAVNLVSLCVAEDLLELRRVFDESPQRLRGGEMLVNDNQISLRRHSPRLGGSVSAVMLLGLDDISFCDNQVEVENEVQFILTNTLAMAATLRLATNRLQERITAGFISAITLALMNQTAYNQTTHCIVAIGLPQARIVAGNRSVLGLINPDICQGLERIAGTISSRLGTQSGLTTGGAFAEN
jgi:Family of unknown function (DUF6519)